MCISNKTNCLFTDVLQLVPGFNLQHTIQAWLNAHISELLITMKCKLYMSSYDEFSILTVFLWHSDSQGLLNYNIALINEPI